MNNRLSAQLAQLHALVHRPSEAPRPTVTPRQPSATPQAPSWPSCAELTQGLDLSPGALRVFQQLHALACAVAQARAHAAQPDTVTFHAPQGLLAVCVGYTARHMRRLLPELVTAGLLDWGAHASKVRDMRLWDGCLWSVRVSRAAVVPQIRRDEWRHEWRNFAADIEEKRTVQALLGSMSQLQDEERESALQHALRTCAVTPGNLKSPVACSWDMAAETDPDTAQDVRQLAYRLGELPHIHPTKRAALVGRLASGLSRALGDPHSRRWYCAVIWAAWKGEVEGRGSLQALCAALLRLETDRAEWPDLRKPAALLASRLRAA